MDCEQELVKRLKEDVVKYNPFYKANIVYNAALRVKNK